MKKVIVLIISIAATVLFSCEVGTTFTKNIENCTPETIQVKLHTMIS